MSESPFPASQRSTGAKRSRTASMIIESQPVPSQTVRQIIRYPKRRKYNPYRSQIHKFKRTYNYGTFSSDGINPTLIAFNFSMNDMPGYSELQSLFDFYKLTGVTVKIIPWTQTDSNSQATLNNARNSPFFYAIDRNDSSAPASVDEVLENNDHRISSTYSGANVWIPYPKFSDATGASRDGWVATTNASLNWFGLKVAIPATATANTWYVTVTYYVSCKDAK